MWLIFTLPLTDKNAATHASCGSCVRFSELSNSILTKLQDGLYSATLNTSAGVKLFFGFENPEMLFDFNHK